PRALMFTAVSITILTQLIAACIAFINYLCRQRRRRNGDKYVEIVIFRRPNGDWAWDIAKGIKEWELQLDPFHVYFTCENLHSGSYPWAYDQILKCRLWAEANATKGKNEIAIQLKAYAHFMDEVITEFDDNELDFIFNNDKPLYSLYKMTGFIKLASQTDYFNEDLRNDAIDKIKAFIAQSLSVEKIKDISAAKPKYSTLSQSIKIQTPFGMIVAETTDSNYPGIAIYLENGEDERQLVRVEVVSDEPREGLQALRAYIWGNSTQEDYSEKITFGIKGMEKQILNSCIHCNH
ncbi:MAG: hypothetical protein FWE05_12665, partial [Defluviitaleaceae bacterium]|nr:hypothetical protein [Defluviitaleaceae bacterium]